MVRIYIFCSSHRSDLSPLISQGAAFFAFNNSLALECSFIIHAAKACSRRSGDSMMAIGASVVRVHGLGEVAPVQPCAHGVEFSGFVEAEVRALVAAFEAGLGDVFFFVAVDADFEAAAVGF